MSSSPELIERKAENGCPAVRLQQVVLFVKLRPAESKVQVWLL